METQLDSLIEKLKIEGVQAAQQQSDNIIEDAKKEARRIDSNAQNEAKQIIDQAQQKAENFKTSADAAIQQASRDLILVIKEKITSLLDRVLKSQVQQSLSPDFLKELIIKLIEQMHTKETVEILVSEADKEKLLNFLQEGLKNDLKTEIELKVNNRISRGFRIGIKDQSAYYDITDDSIVTSLIEFLNPSLAKLLEDVQSGKK